MLQTASRTPLLLRQIPVWQHGVATGFIDLALERAFLYREHAPSTVIETAGRRRADHKEARYSMLERLADYDDALMEELIGEIEPPRDRVFDDLAKELREGHIVPLLMGSADRGHGVTRLLKALRHEAPGVAANPRAARRRRRRARRSRRSCAPSIPAMAASSSLARVLRGALRRRRDASSARAAAEERIAGLSRLMGAASAKIARAEEGETVAFARLEHRSRPAIASPTAKRPPDAAVEARRRRRRPKSHRRRIVKDRKDEVRLAAALAKLMRRGSGAGLHFHDQESGEIKLLGQGEMHLRVTSSGSPPDSAWRSNREARGRLSRNHPRCGHRCAGATRSNRAATASSATSRWMSRPRARGEGFAFAETVHGGTVPRQYFSSVEDGAATR